MFLKRRDETCAGTVQLYVHSKNAYLVAYFLQHVNNRLNKANYKVRLAGTASRAISTSKSAAVLAVKPKKKTMFLVFLEILVMYFNEKKRKMVTVESDFCKKV